MLSLTYTAPASLPSSGADSIAVQDLHSSPQITNTDSYAFASSTPVISIGDSTIVEGDIQPGTPADFTVTIQPVQATATTVQYITLCGGGDKGCEEDYKPGPHPGDHHHSRAHVLDEDPAASVRVCRCQCG